VKYKQPNISS